jgi:hypothetical protein
MKKSELRQIIREELIKESPKRKLEKYSDIAWRKLDLEEKIEALHAIGASGSGQMLKLLNKQR